MISEDLTGALEGAAESWGLTGSFVGFVILPIVGNAAEHSTAIVMAWKGKMDLAFGVALGSSTQIALFVLPLMVMIGWAIDQPLDLYFGTFETATTFLSSLIVFFVVQNGQTNWLEGARGGATRTGPARPSLPPACARCAPLRSLVAAVRAAQARCSSSRTSSSASPSTFTCRPATAPSPSTLLWPPP